MLCYPLVQISFICIIQLRMKISGDLIQRCSVPTNGSKSIRDCRWYQASTNCCILATGLQGNSEIEWKWKSYYFVANKRFVAIFTLLSILFPPYFLIISPYIHIFSPGYSYLLLISSVTVWFYHLLVRLLDEIGSKIL